MAVLSNREFVVKELYSMRGKLQSIGGDVIHDTCRLSGDPGRVFHLGFLEVKEYFVLDGGEVTQLLEGAQDLHLANPDTPVYTYKEWEFIVLPQIMRSAYVDLCRQKGKMFHDSCGDGLPRVITGPFIQCWKFDLSSVETLYGSPQPPAGYYQNPQVGKVTTVISEGVQTTMPMKIFEKYIDQLICDNVDP